MYKTIVMHVDGSVQQDATLRAASLLVAGAFGHSRYREWVLGGVTRDLLQRARVPVLFSH